MVEDRLAAAKAYIDRAYALHDSSLERQERTRQMRTAHTEALEQLNACEEGVAASESLSLRALLWALRGKALTLGEDERGSVEAEQLLADAVKLDPSLIDAWNCLGECFWHRGQLETARCTLLGALEYERGADTLRMLSMLNRTMAQVGSADHQTAVLLGESVALAKEAVRQAPRSSKAWQGLGVAHLHTYMKVGEVASELHLAIKALSQAERVAAATDAAAATATGEAAPAEAEAGGAAAAAVALRHGDADLHFNHAEALCHLDEFQGAMDHFGAAAALDAEMGVAAAAMRGEVWDFVVRTSDFLAGKAGVKPKRLAALAAELPAPSGGAVSLSQLAPGDNPGKSVFVKVVAPLPQMRSKHLRFVVVDAQERLIGLSLYALPKGLVQPDATLELTAPHLLKVEARPWDQPGPAAGFHVLRVEEPRAQLRVNGAGVVPRSERQRGGGGGGGGQ